MNNVINYIFFINQYDHIPAGNTLKQVIYIGQYI